MPDWISGIGKELAKRLTPPLAFAALMFILVMVFGGSLTRETRILLYVLIGLGFLVYTIVTVVDLRRKAPPGSTVTEQTGGPNIVNTGSRAQITNFINHFASSENPDQRQELSQQITDYLEWMQECYGVIVVRSIQLKSGIPVQLDLDTVYVPLQAEFHPEVEETEGGIVVEGRAKTDSKPKEQQPQKITLNEVLSLGTRLVITGGPGCGKTTVLQHIAWTLATALLTDQPELAQKKLGISEPLPLPIYVPLTLYNVHLRNLPKDASAEKKTLAYYISQYLVQNQSKIKTINPDFFYSLLREEKAVILLLDGLDEVPSEIERKHVRSAIETLAPAGKDKLRLVVTSRTTAYNGQSVLAYRFQHISVLPLEEKQINQLIECAYNCIYQKSPALAKSRTDDLTKGITLLEQDRQNRLGKDIERLVDSPLMVRLLLIVHSQGKLPDQRADLYQKAVDVLLAPDYALENEVNEELARQGAGSLAMNRDILQHLAFHMHQRGAKQGRTIDKETVIEILKKEPGFTTYIPEIISLSHERGALLEERGGNYSFMHLSFQEFLAACDLAEALRDLETIARFFEVGPIEESWWRETILLLVGYLDTNAATQAGKFLRRLAGLDLDAFERIMRLSVDTQLAAAEIAGAAYLECQNQSPDLRPRLGERLQHLIEQKERLSTPIRPRRRRQHPGAAG